MDALPRGTNNGAVYIGKDGQQRFVKFYENQERAYNEFVANAIYAAANVPSPVSTLICHEGRFILVTDWICGTTLDKPLMMTGKINQQDAEQFLQNFLMDLWLCNYDAFGLNGDNALKDNAGVIHRIDNGGALLFRARGKLKTDKELNLNSDPSLLVDDIEQYIHGGSGGRDGYSYAFRALRIKSKNDLAFLRLVTPQVARLQALRDNTNDFESIIPMTSIEAFSSLRENILRLLRCRAAMLSEKVFVRCHAYFHKKNEINSLRY